MVMTKEQIAEKPLVGMREFFSAKRPVLMVEFQEFWKACTEEERKEFRDAILKWDGVSEFISLS